MSTCSGKLAHLKSSCGVVEVIPVMEPIPVMVLVPCSQLVHALFSLAGHIFILV